MGYEIESQRGPNGKDFGFEIEGVPKQVRETYSKCSGQRDKAISEFIEANNRPPTHNEVAILVRESRADKLMEISTAEVQARHQARLSPEEWLGLQQIRESILVRSQNQHVEISSGGPSLDHAERHVFEHVSVAVEHQLLT